MAGHRACAHVSRLSLGNSRCQLPPQILYGIRVQRPGRTPQSLKSFFLSHYFVALAVCFRSLSCWKTHPGLIISGLADARRFSSKILQYLVVFISPSMWWSLPVPLAEKKPQNRVVFSPPSLTVGMVFWGHQHFSASKQSKLS